ncbi:MAG TPA: Sua5/YciO/YrdC/YwlC family protein [Gaiellales bacterium]|nr:Sua5/YciO/YrdC/YwlC family protein [Gaiellales bacterium]
MPSLSDRLQALRGGGICVLPTDTVYGIGAAAGLEEACLRAFALKRRPPGQPTALVAGSVAGLVGALGLDGDGPEAAVLAALLPGPLTLVIANPRRRFRHLCGSDPGRIGVRAPALRPEVAELADGAGGLALTSANLHGGPDPAVLGDVPPELRAEAAVIVDGGRLPGAASAVIDVTGGEPRILRDGPGVAQALRSLARLG